MDAVPKGETASSSGGKRSRRSLPNDGAQKDWAIVSMESPDRASNDQLAWAGASLEEGVSIVSSPNVEEVGKGPPLGVVTALVPPPRPTGIGPSKKQLPDQVLLSTYVPLLERVHPLTGMVAPDLEGVLEIVHHWSPFNQAESSVAHMCDLYQNYF